MKKLFLTIIAIVCAGHAFSQERWGVINVAAAFAMSEPDYTSSVETQFPMGSVVEILEQNGYWIRVRSEEPEYEAWMNELEMTGFDGASAEKYKSSDKYLYTALYGNVLKEPRRDSDRHCDISMGGLLRVSCNDAGRAIRKGMFLEVILPSGEKGYVGRKDVVRFREWAQSVKPDASGVIAVAQSLVGAPYVWGGNSSTGLDCSGLVRLSFFMNGIILPRNVSQQVKCGIEVPLDAIEPGDLLFFGKYDESGKLVRLNHVAIYIGDGRFIHSSQKVRISSLASGRGESYDRAPACARRVLGAIAGEYSLRACYFPE